MRDQAFVVSTDWMLKPLTNERVRTLVHHSDVVRFERVERALRSALSDEMRATISSIQRAIFWNLYDFNYRLKL
jgi:hypothetical protein